MVLDFESIAKRYNITADTVKQKFSEFSSSFRDDIARKYPTDVDAKIEEYFVKNISELFTVSAFDRAKARVASGDLKELSTIIFAIKPAEDKFGIEKRMHKNAYYKNPSAAIGAKLVEERTNPETGKKYPVPIYNNEYIVDFNGQPIPGEDGKPQVNPNYEKEIETRWINKLLLLIDDTPMIGTITSTKEVTEHTPRIGFKSYVLGKIFQGKYVNIAKDGYYDVGKFTANQASPQGLFSLAKTYLEPMDEFIPLNDVARVNATTGEQVEPCYKMRIVKGNLMSKGSSSEYSSYIVVNDKDVPSGLKFTTSYAPLRNIINNIPVGAEVYAVFDKRRFKPEDSDELKEYNKLWGVIAPDGSDNLQDEIQKTLRSKKTQ